MIAPSELINRDVCDSLDALAGQNIIAQPQSRLPGLLFACGQAFERAGNTGAALSFYSRFRADYPGHTLLAEVEAAFVRATIAEAEAFGAGDLPAPRAVGASTGAGGLVTVVIQNDEALSVVFNGPDVRVEELGSCAECARFSGSTPAACPAIGPVGTYTLAPGTYDVVVKARGDGRVTPFRGTWSLDGGREYASCFYLVRQQ